MHRDRTTPGPVEQCAPCCASAHYPKLPRERGTLCHRRTGRIRYRGETRSSCTWSAKASPSTSPLPASLRARFPRRACAKFVESKLDLIPRYRQRAVFPSFNLGLPNWELDPNFDILNHVHEVVLKQGTDSDFKAETAKVISSTLDRNHPLWDITLVQGLKGNRTGHDHPPSSLHGGRRFRRRHYERTARCQPDARQAGPPKQPRPERPRPTDSVAMLLDEALKSYQTFMQGALTAQSEVLTIARGVARWSDPGPHRRIAPPRTGAWVTF